jgi:hypothetical protein
MLSPVRPALVGRTCPCLQKIIFPLLFCDAQEGVVREDVVKLSGLRCGTGKRDRMEIEICPKKWPDDLVVGEIGDEGCRKKKNRQEEQNVNCLFLLNSDFLHGQ